MILDKQLMVSEAQSAVGWGGVSGTSHVSTNSIDLKAATDVGQGEDLYLVYQVANTGTADAFTAAGALTVSVSVILSANSDLSSAFTIATNGAFHAKANLTAAAGPWAIRLSPRLLTEAAALTNGARYLGVSYYVTSASGTATAGKITAYFTKDIQDGKKYYASGYTVS